MAEQFVFIDGGVTAAKGFKASGEHLGIRKNRDKRDTALIVSDTLCTAACCYTQNLVQGAPIAVTKAHVADGHARAILCNSGNANTCNANGKEIAEGMCALVTQHTGVPAGDVVVASTGVIGQPMSLDPFEKGMRRLAVALRHNGGHDAAEAIMTTDTVAKEVAVEFTLGGRLCRMGGISKGSGMIHPNMATMLCFITTDAAIAPDCLQTALSGVVKDTFNMLSVDGDTSTNDMVTVLAGGLAGNPEIAACDGPEYGTFKAALYQVCAKLCRIMAKDGEGATKLMTCTVTGAPDKANAKLVAKSVVCSTLLKAAIFGADANWGRVLCAIGYSGAAVDIGKIDVQFQSRAGVVSVCTGGSGVPFSEEDAKLVLSESEIDVAVQLNAGTEQAVAWGCDLTYDYVKINGDYRT
ncbi:MAG TPA: bifunctional glutamate N-acetyltransferase/amino-acid acetyltransferase ArgJ [Candidatus Limiplasma sp.]|jgi:glutamate N-acetyltransferase/amino-acid N-acetyltransferase|nr:bifunctional glutamate N-acetyltransferase/amino-acid acetyltransferase ArgJ [Candidatus Limiplasma sp.]HPR77276.1 bifunctional glutamate N-acetyltransferase/amino-acid acetyltransferase ArgJ [Candidatus Limiplasma sp.]